MLFGRCTKWLAPEGLLFLHIFVHRAWPYHFEARGEDDWMARYFFTGGTMPCDSLLLYFADALAVENHWHVNGGHYALTSEDWLKNLDRNRAAVNVILERTYAFCFDPQRTDPTLRCGPELSGPSPRRGVAYQVWEGAAREVVGLLAPVLPLLR